MGDRKCGRGGEGKEGKRVGGVTGNTIYTYHFFQ